MKYGFPILFFLLILFSFTGSTSFSTHNEDDATLSEFQIRNLATFCKVWGFLKYYHPHPSKKDVDWDKVLIENYPKVISASTKEEFNRVISSIFNLTGPLKSKKSSFHPVDSLARNVDFSWLADTMELSLQNSEYLQSVLTRHKPFKNKYVHGNAWTVNPSFNENGYTDMLYPTEEYRFLSLCRHWNIIEYYFPSKYLMDHNWDTTLIEAVVQFHDCNNKEDYFRAIQWTTSRIDDGHGFCRAPWIPANKYPFISTYYYRDTLVVTYIGNDSIAKICSIQPGDKIISINGTGVKDVWEDLRAHRSASNQAFAEFSYANSSSMFRTDRDTSELTVIRNGNVLRIKEKNYTPLEIMKLWQIPSYKMQRPTSVRVDTISNTVYGYFNMGTLQKNEVDSLFSLLTNVNSLILDARNYPRQMPAWIHLANNIVTPRQFIARASAPDYDHPGYLRFNMVGLKVGTTSGKCFHGHVYILVDHTTMSQAEYQVMALRLAPNATVIGTQTAGADGDVSTITLPGNYTTRFSGLGWYYADGRQTQRIGIVPDIKVEYTVETELAQRDPIMEKALELIRAGK